MSESTPKYQWAYSNDNLANIYGWLPADVYDVYKIIIKDFAYIRK
jgi:hypothetical protein